MRTIGLVLCAIAGIGWGALTLYRRKELNKWRVKFEGLVKEWQSELDAAHKCSKEKDLDGWRDHMMNAYIAKGKLEEEQKAYGKRYGIRVQAARD